MVWPGLWVTANGAFVAPPAGVSPLATPRAASEDAETRVVRSPWSRGPRVVTFGVAAVGCSLDGAEEPAHSGFSTATVTPAVAPGEVEATAEVGAVCVSGGPSEEAGVELCGPGRPVWASTSAGSRSAGPTAEESSFWGTEGAGGWVEGGVPGGVPAA